VNVALSSESSKRKSGNRQRESISLLSNGKANNLYNKQQASLLKNPNAASNTLSGMSGHVYGLNTNVNHKQQMLRGRQQQHNVNNFNQMGFPFAFGSNNFNNPIKPQSSHRIDNSAGSLNGINMKKMLSGQEKRNKPQVNTSNKSSKKEQKVAKKASTSTSTTLSTVKSLTTQTPIMTSTTVAMKKQIREPKKRTTTSAP
jgi:hypothetical protein